MFVISSSFQVTVPDEAEPDPPYPYILTVIGVPAVPVTLLDIVVGLSVHVLVLGDVEEPTSDA